MTGPSGPEHPLLRIVVVAYHPGDVLDRLLASVPAALTAPHEVVVVDNGGTLARPGTTRVDPGGNLGYGRGANVGAGAATGALPAPWLLVVNQDVAFEPGSLDTLLAATDRWPAAACFGPAILTPDGQLYPSARALPSLGRGVGHALLGWCWPTNPWTAAYRREAEVPAEGVTGWLSGSCMLLRRSAFDAVGGFDPGYFMYFEDTDLCARLAARGGPSVYVPAAVIEHLGGQATSRASRRMLRAHHVSALRFLRRRYPLLTPLLALGLGARYLASLLVPGLGAGATPTRDGDLLDDVAPQPTRRGA